MASSANILEGNVTTYVLDAARSRFQVRASATGLLSSFGHNPTVAIRKFTGEAWFRPQDPDHSSLRLSIDASSLAVTSDSSDKDRQEMERAMKDDVLETSQYPEILFESSAVESNKLSEGMYRMKISGKLTLHGVTHDVELPCTAIVSGDTLRANGEFTIRQTDYGIHLVSVAAGTLKLKDELKFTFDIAASRQKEPVHG